MTFKFVPNEVGRSQLVLTGEPNYIVPLQIAPPTLEDRLKVGRWLILSMSVWNVNDIRAGHRAVEIIKQYKGIVSLGLRPFDYPSEHETWVPKEKLHSLANQIQIMIGDNDQKREIAIQAVADATPLWVAMMNGQVLEVYRGRLDDSRVKTIIESLINRDALAPYAKTKSE